MNQRENLIDTLRHPRSRIAAALNKIDLNREIYPLWTIREMLAHLCGWDDTAIAYIQALIAGQIPPTPADCGINAYNAESVASREGLDYDQLQREFNKTRQVLVELLQMIPDEKITAQNVLPWGETGTLADIIRIFGEHEEEHSGDIEKLIEQSLGDS